MTSTHDDEDIKARIKKLLKEDVNDPGNLVRLANEWLDACKNSDIFDVVKVTGMGLRFGKITFSIDFTLDQEKAILQNLPFGKLLQRISLGEEDTPDDEDKT